MKQKPIVISVAAVCGGGKTTITNLLNTVLTNSKALYFDDYEFDEFPKDICEWVDRGSDYDEWNLEPMIRDIQSLLHHQNSLTKYLFLDYPFGYLHKGICEYIDFTIFIDTPLDIAMARRLLRDYIDQSIVKVQSDLKNYLSRERPAYLNMVRTVKPTSDIVIDGSLSSTLIVEKILGELRIRNL